MKNKIKKLISFAALIIAFALPHERFSAAQKIVAPEAETKITAFVNVNVVPMDDERVLTNQTVIVRGGRIAEIGAAKKIKIPTDAVHIDGRGKFLMPGLVDMHAHLPNGSGTIDDAAGQQLRLFLLNGVTTVRNMLGNPGHLVLRDKINRGELIAPTIFTAGAPLLGSNVPSPEAAVRVVAAQKNAGYDLIKIHENLSLETYAAIVAEAYKNGIPFAGHATATVGLERVLKARQTSIEHLDGYIQFIVADNAPVKPTASQIQTGEVLNYVDEKKIPAAVKATKDANVWNTPTLALFQVIAGNDKTEDLLKLPEMRYVPQRARDFFVKQKQGITDVSAADGEKFTRLRYRLTRELQKSGAKLLIGSDPGQFFLIAGFATHKELQSFARAGLTPYQALAAATKNPAEYLSTFMKAPNDFGTIEVGKRADLLLLDANPLQSISNAQKIAGVMTRGHWISKDEILKTLEDIAARNKTQTQ
ncbi:MAG TPA: amidohydrolase family protein [Pyrinomonadaceae bacterium]